MSERSDYEHYVTSMVLDEQVDRELAAAAAPGVFAAGVLTGMLGDGAEVAQRYGETHAHLGGVGDLLYSLQYLPDIKALATGACVYAFVQGAHLVRNKAQFASDLDRATGYAQNQRHSFTVPQPETLVSRRKRNDMFARIGGGALALAAATVSARTSLETSVVMQGAALTGAVAAAMWFGASGKRYARNRASQGSQ